MCCPSLLLSAVICTSRHWAQLRSKNPWRMFPYGRDVYLPVSVLCIAALPCSRHLYAQLSLPPNFASSLRTKIPRHTFLHGGAKRVTAAHYLPRKAWKGSPPVVSLLASCLVSDQKSPATHFCGAGAKHITALHSNASQSKLLVGTQVSPQLRSKILADPTGPCSPRTTGTF